MMVLRTFIKSRQDC